MTTENDLLLHDFADSSIHCDNPYVKTYGLWPLHFHVYMSVNTYTQENILNSQMPNEMQTVTAVLQSKQSPQ